MTSYPSTHVSVAIDLRFFVTTMRLSQEFDSVGDELKAIARLLKIVLGGLIPKVGGNFIVHDQLSDECICGIRSRKSGRNLEPRHIT